MPEKAGRLFLEPSPLLTRLARHPYAVLALFCVLLWLPGILSLPALDRDESRFAESSRQMLESGDWVDIRFGHVPRYKKPVGIYWLQAAATAVTRPLDGAAGDHPIWTYRLPSLAGGMVAVWLTFWCAAGFAGAEIGVLAGLLMLGSVLLIAEATIATTDAVLLACVLGTQGVLLRIYTAARDPDVPSPSTAIVLAGWAALALGILVKGPVVVGAAAVTLVALIVWDWRGGMRPGWLARTKPLLGVPLALVIVLPWLVAIGLASHGAFFQQSLGDDFAAKIAGGQESHGAPPGYFLALAMLTFWPAILFVLPGIGLGIARRGEPAIRFLLAWAGASWLMFEAVPTKLPQYILPAYPALAILAALFIASRDRPHRALSIIAALQFLVGLAALAAAAILLPQLYGDGFVWGFAVPALVAVLIGLAALVLCLRGAAPRALPLTLIALFLLVPVLTAGVGPRLTQLWMSDRLAVLVTRDARPGDPPPALAGYEEPSLVFALGPDVGLTNGYGAAELGANSGGLALVDDAERPAFVAHLADLRADAHIVDSLTGFNYSRGKIVHITVYRVAPVHQVTTPPPE